MKTDISVLSRSRLPAWYTAVSPPKPLCLSCRGNRQPERPPWIYSVPGTTALYGDVRIEHSLVRWPPITGSIWLRTPGQCRLSGARKHSRSPIETDQSACRNTGLRIGTCLKMWAGCQGNVRGVAARSSRSTRFTRHCDDYRAKVRPGLARVMYNCRDAGTGQARSGAS